MDCKQELWWQGVIHATDVFGESVQNAAGRICVEKYDWGFHDCCDHLVVKFLRCSEQCVVKQERNKRGKEKSANYQGSKDSKGFWGSLLI